MYGVNQLLASRPTEKSKKQKIRKNKEENWKERIKGKAKTRKTRKRPEVHCNRYLDHVLLIIVLHSILHETF